MPSATPEDPTPEASAADVPAADDAPDAGVPATPDEDMRRKFLQALAHKHAGSGVASSSRGPGNAQGHGSQNTRQSRMFRRKSGG